MSTGAQGATGMRADRGGEGMTAVMTAALGVSGMGKQSVRQSGLNKRVQPEMVQCDHICQSANVEIAQET